MVGPIVGFANRSRRSVIWCCRHCRCRGAGRVGKAGDRRRGRGRGGAGRARGRGGGRGAAAVPAVRRGAGLAGGGAAPPGRALPARQPRVPGGQLCALLRAPQLRAQPHAHQAPAPVGAHEDAQVELRLGRLGGPVRGRGTRTRPSPRCIFLFDGDVRT